MSGNKLIIITAEDADLKTINKLILTLRDWEFGDEEIWDHCKIIRTTKDITADSQEIDVPPLQEAPALEFRGKTVDEMENLMLAKAKEGSQTSLFLLLDSQGIEQETIIVAHRAINPEEDSDSLYLDEYDKVRVPWIEAHTMWCNLDIANMNFEEYCEEVDDRPRDGWYNYKSIMGENHHDEFIQRRDKVLRELAKLDLA